MVTACLHNFGLEVDGWIDDAPQVHENNDDEENENFFDDEEEEIRSNEKSIKRKNYIGSEEDSITSGQDEFYDEDGLSIEQS